MQAKTRNSLLIGIIGMTIATLYFGQIYLGTTDADGAQSVSNPVPEGFVIPEFDRVQLAGQIAFEANCQVCHGQFGLGTNKGPPFMNEIYAPPIHADGAFVFAVSQGSQQHHWNFGNMPAVEGVSDDEVTAITAFVRALQSANGYE